CAVRAGDDPARTRCPLWRSRTMNRLRWCLPGDLLRASVEIMRPNGADGNEGLALWLGCRSDAETAHVTHLVEVYGSGFRTLPLHVSLSVKAISGLDDLAESLDCYLLGQIHSHPRNFLDLSELDKEHGIRVPDYLSVVCPHYAQRGTTRLRDCGIHVFE